MFWKQTWLLVHHPAQPIDKGTARPKVKNIDVHEVVEPASTPHRVEQPLLLVCDDRLPIEGHRVAGTVCHGQLGELLVLELAGHHGVASGEAKRSSGSSVHQHHSGVTGVCYCCVRSLRVGFVDFAKKIQILFILPIVLECLPSFVTLSTSELSNLVPTAPANANSFPKI